jgi:thiol-disulfide isomerase/thioredoxin
MAQLTSASWVRILLLVLVGVVLLQFIWAQFTTEPTSSGRSGFGMSMGAACPAAKATHGQADYDWQLRAVGGDETALHVFKNRVVFVNVWATWCGPCRDEMPSIQALYDTMEKEGVAFVIVSEEEEYVISEFVRNNHYTFPTYTSRGEIPSVFASNGIPVTFVVDRDGRIVLRRVGSADWNEKACQDFLRSLLAPPATQARNEPHNLRAAR